MEPGHGSDVVDQRSLPCIADCKLLSVTGVLTLDEDDHLEFFCDRCDLHRY